jgi:hypothetical protein
VTESTHAASLVHAAQATVDEWWATPEADEVEGYDLLRDEALFDIVGLPFLASNVIYRDGIQRPNVPYRDDYASVELRIAPSAVVLRDLNRIQARRKSFNVAPLTVDQAASLPGQQFVLNDGSTGLYRQITEYVAAKELIKLPDGEIEGSKGESILDLPRSQWLSGAEEASAGLPILLRCSRGVRYSRYKNEYTGDKWAVTWYLA